MKSKKFYPSAGNCHKENPLPVYLSVSVESPMNTGERKRYLALQLFYMKTKDLIAELEEKLQLGTKDA